VWGMPWHQKA